MNFMERIGLRKKELVDLEIKKILSELKTSVEDLQISVDEMGNAVKALDRRHYRERKPLTDTSEPGIMPSNEVPKQLW